MLSFMNFYSKSHSIITKKVSLALPRDCCTSIPKRLNRKNWQTMTSKIHSHPIRLLLVSLLASAACPLMAQAQMRSSSTAMSPQNRQSQGMEVVTMKMSRSAEWNGQSDAQTLDIETSDNAIFNDNINSIQSQFLQEGGGNPLLLEQQMQRQTIDGKEVVNSSVIGAASGDDDFRFDALIKKQDKHVTIQQTMKEDVTIEREGSYNSLTIQESSSTARDMIFMDSF